MVHPLRSIHLHSNDKTDAALLESDKFPHFPHELFLCQLPNVQEFHYKNLAHVGQKRGSSEVVAAVAIVTCSYLGP